MALKILRSLPRAVPKHWQNANDDEKDWTVFLGAQIDDYLVGEKQAALAVSLGRRRPNFLPTELTIERKPLFSLTHLPTLLFSLGTIDNKVNLLRRIGSRIPGMNEENSVILCFRMDGAETGNTYASVFPEDQSRPQVAEARMPESRHHHLISVPMSIHQQAEDAIEKEKKEVKDQRVPGGPFNLEAIRELTFEEAIAETTHKRVPDGFISLKDFRKLKFDQVCAIHLDDVQRLLHPEKVEYLETEFEPWFHGTLNRTVEFGIDTARSYEYLLGQADDVERSKYYPITEHAAIYYERYPTSETPAGKHPIYEVGLEDVLWCFESDIIDPERLKKVLENEPAFGFLKVLSAIWSICRDPSAGGATISSAIVDSTFQPPVLPRKLDRHEWLVADSYLIGGRHAAIGLIGDPGEKSPDHSFTRVLGNTGTPGCSILTLPSGLMARNINPSAWRVEPVKFDWAPVDSFKNTSIHSGFTEWCAPLVQFPAAGLRDYDVNIVEAVVSVPDCGEWVAAIDIDLALTDGRLWRGPSCTHSRSSRLGESKLLSVETWDQILDPLDGPLAVRSFDNWLARLALVSVLCQHSQGSRRPIVLWYGNMCWKCNNLSSMYGATDGIHIC
ncbi:Uu.00g112260.m01.CDS01 [Anthostomella pinea]|uniref:Uu.00g112260.m01.CDS01 n=1 Tax=Anthostomella pinea TaxID=933095 RepID=A0AAI8VA34_9PEZI|nr:Uu.00g112260.m01.CDS01 [Anthostomella pinea]